MKFDMKTTYYIYLLLYCSNALPSIPAKFFVAFRAISLSTKQSNCKTSDKAISKINEVR